MAATMSSLNQVSMGDLVLSYSEDGVNEVEALNLNGQLNLKSREMIVSVS